MMPTDPFQPIEINSFLSVGITDANPPVSKPVSPQKALIRSKFLTGC
jgi:hypothetical protein